MILNDFDITLQSLKIDDIEMIRHWRNSPDINRYALDKKHITKQQQEAWFHNLGEDEYFIIHLKQNPVGLIWFNKKEDDIQTGFYIYNATKQNSLLAYKIVTVFHNYLFNIKKLKSITCKIQNDNTRAIRFNKSLGYKKYISYQEYGLYKLEFLDYMQANQKIIKLLK